MTKTKLRRKLALILYTCFRNPIFMRGAKCWTILQIFPISSTFFGMILMELGKKFEEIFKISKKGLNLYNLGFLGFFEGAESMYVFRRQSDLKIQIY